MSREHEEHFNALTLNLLTEQERQLLYKGLNRYMKNKNVTEFAVTVREICNTSLKVVLLDYIRGYLPRSDRKQFDKITVFNRGEYTAGMDVKSRSKVAGELFYLVCLLARFIFIFYF